MQFDEALEFIEQTLLPRSLSSIEKFILQQSQLNQTYTEMASACSYDSVYIREIGSQLWQELSEVLGERVTKKNLYLVIKNYQQSCVNEQQSTSKQQFQTSGHTRTHFLDAGAPEIKLAGDSLPSNSPFYINRPPIEELAYSEVGKPGCVIRIMAPRQMGKRSLLNRVIAHAKAQSYETVHIDLQEADEAVFTSLDRFLRWFCINVTMQLNVNPQMEEYWNEDLGSKVSCKLYFERYLLKQTHHPILLGVSELDRVCEHPSIAQDFLSMLRFWHELVKQVEVWQKLRLVLVHSTDSHISLRLNQSPFNVGLSIRLPGFTLEQVQNLAQRYGLNWAKSEREAQQLASLVEMVGGHPYLVSVAFYHLHRQVMTLEELLQFAPTQAGIYGDHLQNLLALLLEDGELVSALRQVVTMENGAKLKAITAHRLEGLGLVQLDGNEAKPICQLYRLYFLQQLNKNQLTPHFVQSENKEQFQHLGTLRHPGSIDINNRDYLTQLASWYFFNTYLEINWQQWMRDKLVLSLILCDIDYFKFYNDAHGQLAGDAGIQQIANTIHECVRYQAILTARNGGTKFVALLPHTDADTTTEIAKLIQEQVKALGLTHDQSKVGGFPSQFLTVSVGAVSITLNPDSSPEKLLAAAEDALVKAKRGGRDRVVCVC